MITMHLLKIRATLINSVRTCPQHNIIENSSYITVVEGGHHYVLGWYGE